MLKIEMIWRYVLTKALNEEKFSFTQKDLAYKLGVSTSTVFQSLKSPRRIGVVSVTGRNFRLTDFEKLLTFWATVRNFTRDIIWETSVGDSVFGIEGNMPADVIFGAYSCYRLTFGDVPTDYDHVYVYTKNLKEIQKRFPKKGGIINLTVLSPDPLLASFGSTTPLPQLFVDLWNLPQWYAKDFYEALKEHIQKQLRG